MYDGTDAYEVLGVSPEATTAEIRKAWLTLCRRYHPDKAKNEEEVKEYTIRMFKINAAYEILSDETKRREYDEGSQENDDEGSVDSNRSDEQEEFHEPPRAEPGHLGRPYQGSKQSTPFFFDCNGADGAHAVDGRRGSDGSFKGADGENGQDAGRAMPGSWASNLKISIKTTMSASGYFQVNIYATRDQGEVMDPTRPNLTNVPLKVFASVDFSAAGGAGGHGGRGGDGGNGAKGRRGSNATEYSSGTSGGPGGDGGAGGRGTDGADGGGGGDVQIQIDLEDIYLLMRVDACDPCRGVQSRVSGGRGGNPGEHGKSGRGGPGGRGGRSCSWSEYHSKYVNGHNVSYTVDHYNPGGPDGRPGRDGYTPSCSIRRGRNGPNGKFHIYVESSSGTEEFLCPRRYDLTFQDSITKHLSDMPGRKTFEFGETVLVTACLVRNSGGMPTPRQRAMIAFEHVKGVNPTSTDRLFLQRNSNLPPKGEQRANEGYLRYFCPFPSSSGTDYDPIRKTGYIQYMAHQLGPENDTTDRSLISDFKEKYMNFQKIEEQVEMAFPIENRAGILGIHSLGVRETTMLQLKLYNTSNQTLGSVSRAKRALFVKLYYANDRQYEIPLDTIVVRGDGGEILNIDPSQGRAYRKTVFTLPRRSDTTIQLTLKLNAGNLRACASAGLQADIYLQKIPTLHPDGTTSTDGKKRLVQRRLFLVSHQPKFDENEGSDVVLVTTTASTADQVTAWESLISDRLGLRPKVYSLSRYGHFDATKVGEEKKLRESLAGKLVVMLNEQYCAQPNVESERNNTCRPSQLMNSVFDFDEFTRFLVVGGQADTVQHMSPKAAGINTIEARKVISPVIQQKMNRKSFQNDFMDFIKTERTQGFPQERVAPSCQVVRVKTRTVFRTPIKSRFETTVERRSQMLQRWLAKNDKLRHYRIEWEAFDKPARMEGGGAEKGWRRRCWHVGEFRIYVGPPRFQNAMVLLGEETPETRTSTLSASAAIRSLSMIHSTVYAAPFETKMKIYCCSLRDLSESPSQDHEDVCTAVRLSLANDFLWDVSNYYHGRMKVESPDTRSPTLRKLLSNENLRELIDQSLTSDGIALKEVVTKEMSMLLAGFQSAAESKDLRPWWSPFSRKHLASRAMREALEPLQQQLSSLINKETLKSERVQIELDAKHHIRKVRGKFWLRARGRWREALAVAHSPSSPRHAAHSISTIRTRREAELDIGTSHKVKRLSAETATQQDSQAVRQHLQRRLASSTTIHRTTQSDRNLFIQT